MQRLRRGPSKTLRRPAGAITLPGAKILGGPETVYFRLNRKFSISFVFRVLRNRKLLLQVQRSRAKDALEIKDGEVVCEAAEGRERVCSMKNISKVISRSNSRGG